MMGCTSEQIALSLREVSRVFHSLALVSKQGPRGLEGLP